MRPVLLLLLLLLFACEGRPRPIQTAASTASAPHRGEILSGRIVGISDGDTLKVLTADLTEHKIRLAGIDTPEKAQAFGKVAKYELRQRAFGKQADVRVLARDRYGRSVAMVFVDGKDLGLAMLEAGLAWFYRDYQKDLSPEARQAYDAAETKAKQAGEGLWRDADPTPPWAWRREKRKR